MVAAGNESQHVVLSGQIAAARAPETQSLMDDDAFVLAVGAVRGEQIPAVVVPYPDGVGKVRRAVWGKQDMFAVDVREVRHQSDFNRAVAAHEQVAVGTLQPDVARSGTFEYGNSADSHAASG